MDPDVHSLIHRLHSLDLTSTPLENSDPSTAPVPSSIDHQSATAPSSLDHATGAHSNKGLRARGRSVFVIGGNFFDNRGTLINNNYYQQPTTNLVADALLEHNSPNAIHSSSAVANQGTCMPGTRAFTLQRLQSLLASVEDSDPDLIWMRGSAGAGKSAILRTMANALEEQGSLLGSFFFFRADTQRNTCTPFIPTLAFQAFESLPSTQPHIQRAILSQRTIFAQSIQRQLRFLVEIPLKLSAAEEPTWSAETPFVIVIDGLDECSDADRQVEIIQAMRQLVSTIRSSTDRRIKVLFASRPEPRIKDEFEGNGGSVTIIKLEPDDANIDLYYDVRLDEIRRRNNLPESWPSPDQIRWLNKKADGQYSFAHISIGFMGGGDPVERLKMLQTGIVTHGLEPFAALDALYAFIFYQVPPEMRHAALLVVRLVLAMGSPRFDRDQIDFVERILSLRLGLISCLSPYLSSILDVDQNYSPYHASLGDFLHDPLRSSRYSLFIDIPTFSTIIVEGMLGFCITVPGGSAPTIRDFDILHDWFSISQYHDYYSNFQVSSRLIEITHILPSLLPTMDRLCFGYCCTILASCTYPYRLTEVPHVDRHTNCHFFDLLPQIYTLQQIHFSPYEKLEVGGDSGLGLFGIFLILASHFPDSRSGAEESMDAYPFGLEQIALSLLSENAHLLLPQSPMPQTLILHHIVHEAWATKKRHQRGWHGCVRPTVFYTAAFVSSPQAGVASRKCLSRTVELFLDLPLGQTRIQKQILTFVSCPDHPTLNQQCDICAQNLVLLQASGIHAVYEFWFLGDPDYHPAHWQFDVNVFDRACVSIFGIDLPEEKRHTILRTMQIVGGYAEDYDPELGDDKEILSKVLAKISGWLL